MSFPTIGIQSPYLQDNDGFHAVSDAQKILKKRGYYHGAIDGVLGPITASSFSEAKWFLGYNRSKCTKVFGALLMSYLNRTRKPNSRMKLLRSRRLRKAVRRHASRKLSPQSRLVRKLTSQIGQTEHPPHSNRSKFSLWYRMIGPWCAMFISWGMAQIGFGKKYRYAYVPTIYALAHESRSGLSVIHPSQVRAGDQYLCDWNRNGVFDHIGVATSRVVDNAWSGIEGNTSVGNLSNGGKVLATHRNMSQGRFSFIRFNFR